VSIIHGKDQRKNGLERNWKYIIVMTSEILWADG
jgi:hypothetical protein